MKSKLNFILIPAILAITLFFTLSIAGVHSNSANVSEKIDSRTSVMQFNPTADEENDDSDAPDLSDFPGLAEKIQKNKELAELKLPDWWLEPPVFDSHIIIGRGCAVFDSIEDMQNAKTQAELNARYEIASKLGVSLEADSYGNAISFTEETNFNMSLAKQHFVEIKKYDESYCYFVLFTYSLYNLVLDRLDEKDFKDYFSRIDFLIKELKFRGADLSQTQKPIDPKVIQKIKENAEKAFDDLEKQIKEKRAKLFPAPLWFKNPATEPEKKFYAVGCYTFDAKLNIEETRKVAEKAVLSEFKNGLLLMLTDVLKIYEKNTQGTNMLEEFASLTDEKLTELVTGKITGAVTKRGAEISKSELHTHEENYVFLFLVTINYDVLLRFVYDCAKEEFPQLMLNTTKAYKEINRIMKNKSENALLLESAKELLGTK